MICKLRLKMLNIVVENWAVLQGASVRRSTKDSVFKSDQEIGYTVQALQEIAGDCRIDNESLQDCTPFGDGP